jgi:hypothetical protein
VVNGQQNESNGDRYMSISKSTNGTSSNILNDFSTVLDDIGTTISELVDSFALSAAPYQGKVRVFVNNVEMLSGWTFNSTSKTISFDATNIPTNGSVITVKYQVQVN